MVVDHMDQNRSNNHITNLRWATYSENTINATRSPGQAVQEIDQTQNWRQVNNFFGYNFSN
jgi:hypothetical protein